MSEPIMTIPYVYRPRSAQDLADLDAEAAATQAELDSIIAEAEARNLTDADLEDSLHVRLVTERARILMRELEDLV